MEKNNNVEREIIVSKTNLQTSSSKSFGQESLAPQGVRIMDNVSYTFAWIAGVININSFMMGASLVPPTGVLNMFQGTLAMLIGVSIMVFLMTLNAEPGHKYGIPFIVHARTAFGIKGSIFPGFIRSLPAIMWYGIQSWIGAMAINSVANVLFGFDNLVICFIGFQILQILLSILGFKGIKWLENIGAVFIIGALGVMFYVIYTTYKADIIMKLINYKGSWGFPLLAGISTFGGTYATYVISMGDLSRELDKKTSRPMQLILHWIGCVPFTMFMAVIGLMVSGTTGSWDPIALFTKLMPNKPLLIMTLLFIAFAQVTTNVLHNVVPSAYVFMEYFNLDYKKSAILVGILAMCTFPWVLITGTGFVLFVQIVSAFLIPLAVVMIVDFYVLRNQVIDIDELYDPNGPFSGINWQGLVAALVGAAVAIIFVEISWIASIIPTSISYWVLCKYFPLSKKFLTGTIFDPALKVSMSKKKTV